MGTQYQTFDPQVLEATISGLRYDWSEGYSNHPRVKPLLLDSENLRYGRLHSDDFVYTPYIGGRWLGRHPSGLREFLSHSGSDTNEGGFSGAKFELNLVDGQKKVLHGPWSGRAGIYNDIELIVDSYPHNITLEALCYILDKHKRLGILTPGLFIVEQYRTPLMKADDPRGERWFMPSMAPDRIVKPSGMDVTDKRFPTRQIWPCVEG